MPAARETLAMRFAGNRRKRFGSGGYRDKKIGRASDSPVSDFTVERLESPLVRRARFIAR
jgi:hypothetical protein